jgi:raffinose/stachyose/melibiose transport system permease protein
MNMVGKAIRRWWPLFALPTFAAFIIGFIIPFIMGIYLSFTKFTTVVDAKWVGLRNYKNVFSDPTFIHSIWFTVLFTVITTVIINVLGFFVAYMLTKAFKGVNLFRSVFFMPNLIGGIVLGYIWQLVINAILLNWKQVLTNSEWYGLMGLVALVCWQQIGYMMVIYIAGLQNLPGDVMEAADVDGANSRQKLFKVTLPLMMPSITVCSFLTVTNGFKLFDQNLALTSGNPAHQTELLALNIYNTFYGRVGFQGIGQAKAVIFFIVVAAIAILQNRLTTRKEVIA